jgi:autotransporter passenger strand-loop-strand repeat protein
MTSFTISSGSTSGQTLSNGQSGIVLAGGTSISITVSSGGTEIVSSGGTAFKTTVSSGGTEIVSAGGTAISGTLSPTRGGTEIVISGGVDISAALESASALQIVASGGTAIAATLQSGFQAVSAGGTALNTHISRVGLLAVYSGGFGYGDTVSTGGTAIAASGGVISGMTLSSGGNEEVDAGGTMIGNSVKTGATEVVSSGGTYISTIVTPGGDQRVISGGTATDTTILTGGTETILSGGTAIGLVVSSGGTMIVSAGGVASAVQLLSGFGTAIVLSGGTAIGMVLSGGTALLSAGAVTSLTSLGIGGAIDDRALSYVAGGTATLNSGTDILTVTEGTVTSHFSLSGSYTGEYFHLAYDGNYGGTYITQDNAPCYGSGTLILTDAGERPIEDLSPGDRVITGPGTAMPIKWIGHRSYAGAFIAGQHLMLPVCIKCGALADGVPHTDLTVSPGHAMFVEGQLVPAWRLINGISVVQAEAVESVTYFHIELDAHAVLFANGAPAESFIDDDCRGQFQNASTAPVAGPDDAPILPLAARLEDGFGLQRLQERVAERAGIVTQVEPCGALRGFIDAAGPDHVSGWAQDADSPEEPVALEVLIAGRPVVCVLANGFRADLRRAGMGSGCHGFEMARQGSWPGTVSVRRISDGAVLPAADTAAAAGLAAA